MQTQAQPPVSLTVEQRRTFDHDAGPLRIAAGAGTGKTGTPPARDRRPDRRRREPREILCLTFTVEATKEMRRRVLAALSDREGIDPDELTVQTYHAFAASIVREHAPLIGLDVDAALLDRARQWQLTLESLDRCTFSELEVGWLPTFVGKVLALHEEMLRHVVTPDQVRAVLGPARRGPSPASPGGGGRGRRALPRPRWSAARSTSATRSPQSTFCALVPRC